MMPATKYSFGAHLTPHERALIRAETGCDERTLKRYPDVREASAMRIEKAAKLLGIRLPKRPKAARAA
jgi:hypothetical protein